MLMALIVSCGGAEDRKEKYLEKGKTYFEEKNYNKAKIEVKNVLQIDPKYAEAYYLLGQIEEKQKELIKAIGIYKKAIELNPKYTDAKIRLAKIYVIPGTDEYISMSRELLAEAVIEQPDNLYINFVLAIIEYKVGSKSKALKELEYVVDNKPDLTEAINLLAAIYNSEGNISGAKKILIKGAEDNPSNIPLRTTLGQLLAKNNELLEAEKYFKQAIEIEPENYALQVSLASFYATTNQQVKGERILRDAIEQDDEDVQRYLVLFDMLASKFGLKKAEEELISTIKNKPDLYELKFAQAKFYREIGDRVKAKNILKDIITEKSYDKEGVKARNQLAEILLKEGDLINAKVYVGEVIAEYPNNLDALLIISKLALINLDAVTAINGLRTIVKNEPKNAEASYMLAQAHELNKESLLAENELKKSLEANPVNDQTHVNYARFLISKGRIDESVAVVDKALAYFKDSYDLLSIKLKIVASQGKDSEVLTLLNLMEQADVNNAEVNTIRGQYYLAKNNQSQAIDEFEKAFVKSKVKFEPLKLIVKSHLVNKQPDKALQRLNVILDKEPDDVIANFLTGQVYLTQNKLTDARTSLQKAIDANGEWFPAHSALANTYLMEGDFEKALDVYQESLSKVTNKVPVLVKMASIHENKKEFTKAISIYNEVLSGTPDNKLAANNLASLLLDFGEEKDIKRALDLTKGFEKLKQPALRDTLAWAYAKSGDNLKAVEILKPIVEKSPKVAVFRYHLGYSLYHSGDKAAAKSHLDIAVSSEQNFTGKDKAKELLKTL